MSAGTTNTDRLRLSAVVYEVDGGWMGVCLEHWLFAQALSHATIYAELERVIQVHVAIARESGREPFTYLPPAPQRFAEMFERGTKGPTLLIHLPGDVQVTAPELVVREPAAA